MVEKNKFVKANEFDPLDPIYEGLQDEITNKTAFELLQSLAGSIQTLQGVQLPTETEIVGDSITVDRYYTKITTAGTLSSVNVATINGGDAILDGGVVEIVLPTGTTVTNSTDINGIQTYSGANIVTTDNYVLTLIRSGGKWQETTNANVFVDTIKQIANLAQSSADTANATANSALSGLNEKVNRAGDTMSGKLQIFTGGASVFEGRSLDSIIRTPDISLNTADTNRGLYIYANDMDNANPYIEKTVYNMGTFSQFRFFKDGKIGNVQNFEPRIPEPEVTQIADLGQWIPIQSAVTVTVQSGKWLCFICNIDGGGGYFSYVANGIYSAGTTFSRITGASSLHGFMKKIKEG